MGLLLVACASGAPQPAFAARFEAVGEVAGPTAIAVPPAGADVPWVAEQAGRIVRLEAGKAVEVLDIRKRVASGGEKGLLGLAFAPGWPGDPRVFVNYTVADPDLRTAVVSFRSRDGGRTLDATSSIEILTFVQPYSNHNGGALAFGPDGMLYVAVGDGGAGGDPRLTGQDPSDILGSILRIDVRGDKYVVPADNPLVARAGARPEVWAYGLRNPWGMHFDGATLWWGDVGQDKWEEVDRGVAGGNYGWNVKEGSHCYKVAACAGDFVAPVAEYGHDEGQAVVGGIVYRGPSVPVFDGKYVFADFVSGAFFAVRPEGGALERLGASGLNPSAFGVGRDGTMYVADYTRGVFRARPR